MIRKELSEIENATQTDDECIYRRVNLAEVKEPHTDKVSLSKKNVNITYVLRCNRLSYEIHHEIGINI